MTKDWAEQKKLCLALSKTKMFCPIVTEIWSKMLVCKDHDLERSRSEVKTNGTIGFVDRKNIDLDIKIVILECFSSIGFQLQTNMFLAY